MKDMSKMNPKDVRMQIREGSVNRPTAGMCSGYVQGNLVILPRDLSYDFLLFAHRNPKACPILEVTDVGERELKECAPNSDITMDIPSYRVYKDGVMVNELSQISHIFKDDYVSFLLGCSFTFESALLNHGISIRHIEMGCNVPMYITNIECKKAGIFSGPMVVSMRPIAYKNITKVVQITSKYPRVHGAPIHIGKPSLIGIQDIDSPDFGDSVVIKDDELPVFWACGVTSQAVAMNAKPEIMITHSPGYMFISDIKNADLASL